MSTLALEERRLIEDTIVDYAFGIDLRDRDRLERSLTSDLEVDFTSWGGGRDLNLFTAPRRVSGAAWADNVVRSMGALRATHHLLGPSAIEPLASEPGGGAYRCTTQIQAYHYLPNDRGDNEFVFGGYYDNEVARDAGNRWRIRKLKIIVLWSRGNRFVFQLAYDAGTQESVNR